MNKKDWLCKLKKINLKILTVGHIIFHSYFYGFDYILYPFVIYKYGPLYGGIEMALLDGAICLFIFWIYDLLENDWLGIETVKEMVEEFFKEEEGIAKKSWIKIGKKMLYLIFHKNKAGQFVFLSIHFDALITTIYMRPGYHLYNGFTKKDWKIFWGSIILSNAWWTGVSFYAISIFKDIIFRIF